MVFAPLQTLDWMRMQSIAAEAGPAPQTPAHCLGHPQLCRSGAQAEFRAAGNI